MVKLIILSTILNTCEIQGVQPSEVKIEARKRGKGQRERRRGGSGLR